MSLKKKLAKTVAHGLVTMATGMGAQVGEAIAKGIVDGVANRGKSKTDGDNERGDRTEKAGTSGKES